MPAIGLTNTASFRAKPGMGDALGKALLQLVAPTRSESGSIRYDIFQSRDNPDTWFVYEDWRTTQDFEAHMNTTYVKAFMENLPTLCGQDVDIQSYQMRSDPA